ncbi:MAG: hypothetical protein RUMPE_00817 [Eubacteriales bacterium SKADARSKE-1]|nr:hypothetical protein [Eubacteriales bacterium SKADARSKE-1]
MLCNTSMRKLTKTEQEGIFGGVVIIQTLPGGKGFLESYRVTDDITGESFGPYKDYKMAESINRKINKQQD